ncbi:hypothetical protein UA32_12570 [Photobacterium angustum]|uniref:RES domain-containing protein n=1 Tax=Photobacterium angustum TaxID=661 RepID=A0ABX5H134_PHOAN|nr:RES domain-containing protein [Photobacterium angustum]KJG37780.1 hypothetical protein UA32_12570 [Photobacterium angustum]PSX07049.1 hypothetical protein C0W27_15890 [Photobacterium angustum]
MRKKLLKQFLYRYEGAVFRGHDPRWSFSPESGEGARRNGGRFNPKGIPALYTSLSQSGAWVESQQAFKYKAQPLTICQYDVDCNNILDLTDLSVLDGLSISPESLNCPWLDISTKNETPPSWTLAKTLIDLGVNGVVVRSYASAATIEMKNLVFWSWSKSPPTMVKVIDDFDRLPKSYYD